MKALVAYFSASGITKDVANTLAEVAKAELFELAPKEPYSKADLDWNDANSRTSIECKDKNSRPKLASNIDISPFSVIFLGFPIWWYAPPHIINSFLESQDFTGKIIVPFCTSGGSELGGSVKDLQKSAPNAEFKAGRKFNFGVNRASVRKWLEELGI